MSFSEFYGLNYGSAGHTVLFENRDDLFIGSKGRHPLLNDLRQVVTVLKAGSIVLKSWVFG